MAKRILTFLRELRVVLTSSALAPIIFLVFALAIYGFAGGAGTSEIEDMATLGVGAWLYYAASLFVLGGTDIGLPVEGGMPGSFYLLWVAYFLAPAVTTTFVIDTIRTLLARRHAVVPDLSNHVILLGRGDLASAYLNVIRLVEPDIKIVWVSHKPDEVAPLFKPDPSHPNVISVAGDIFDHAFLKTLSPTTACRAIALHSDDIMNLESSWSLASLNENLVIACHVSDLSLLRPANRLVRAQSGLGGRAPSTFSTHRIASLQVYDLMMEPHFLQTGGRDNIVVAGFGRFAQTLLELVTARGSGEVGQITVMATQAGAHLRQIESEVDLSEFDVQLIDGDIEDPRNWEILHERPASGPPPLIILALADLVGNFRAATLLRHYYPDSRVLVRCFQKTAFTETMAAHLNVDLISLEEILNEALVAHYEALTAI